MSETAPPRTLPGQLAAEISRVTALRETYREAGRRGGSRVFVEPTIALLNRSIAAAIEAAGSPDIEGQIKAVKGLESWKD